ncbi:MAG: YraN family protein [Proteobacteria bacterium]|nr:YraN family protein [Pseudomonadota bacterium]
MKTSQQILGTRAETFALEYLEDQGLQLVERNFSCRYGEIDLILKDSDTLVFTEVRFRTKTNYGDSLSTVNGTKQKKLIKAASFYLLQQKCYDKIPCRFDVIALDTHHDEIAVDWVKNAFGMEHGYY